MSDNAINNDIAPIDTQCDIGTYESMFLMCVRRAEWNIPILPSLLL